jgi:peroxiredoxin/uncharacterized membrane protein YphA (DoxX/SURF4 family)
MELALLIARLLLAGVFVVAGLAKLADRAGSEQSLRNFGVPASLAGPLGILLPLAELAVAAALLPATSAWWGALGALALLLLFIAGIGYNLAQGRAPDCHCFGQLHSTPVGWPTLLRNLGLAVVAGFLIWQGQGNAGPSALSWLGDLAPAQRIGLLIGMIVIALVATEGWILAQALQQQGRLLRRLEIIEAQFDRGGHTVGLAVGSPAPFFSLPDLNGEVVTLNVLRARGLPLVLVFWDPNCGPCQALLPKLSRWQHDYADKLTLVPVSRGAVETNQTKIREYGVTRVLLQQDHEVMDAYQVDATPTAVLVRPDGAIGSPQAGGKDMIESLVAGMVGLLGSSPLLTTTPASGDGLVAAPAAPS